MAMKIKLLTSLLALVLAATTHAQKVVGYIDANLNQAGTRIPQMHWDKLTDFIYGFIQPDGSGNLPNPTTLSHFSTIKTYCSDNGVNMHFSSGGATYSSVFNTIGANTTATKNYAKQIADLLETHGLTGWDLDWEFPRTALEQTYQVNILKAVHDEFTARGKRNAWTIAIAVGGETPSVGAQGVYHTDYCSVNAFQYLDYLNIMSYDIGYNISGNDPNHSSYADAQANVVDWVAKGCPIEKIVLGVPFYARHSSSRYAAVYTHTYSELSASNPAAAYTSNNVGDYYYNGKPLLTQKVDYIMNQGGAGIMIWEVTYDRFDQYSLLDAIADAMAPYQCSAPKPDLGTDKSICGSSSVTLNSGVTTANGRTFTWKKGTQTVVNASATKNTYSATAAGTYTVIVTENGCSNEDQVEVLGILPTINLGPDADLCKPSIRTLDAGVTGNVNYEWKKGSNILSETSQTLQVFEAATYSVTVSDKTNTCTSVSDQITVTSSLINATGAALCSPGTATLKVNESNGNYKWFANITGGTALQTGTTYTPNVTATTYFYVEVEITGGANCQGLAAYDNTKSYGGGSIVIFEGEKWLANWWAGPGESPTATTQQGQWTNQGPCSGTALCDRTPVLAQIEVCTGTETTSEKLEIMEASPIPTNNVLKIDFKKSMTGILTITNLSGQVVMEQNITNTQLHTLDVSNLKNGVYFVQIANTNDHQTIRIIKN